MYSPKKQYVRACIVAALCLCIPLLLWAYASDPPLGYTGAPGDFGTCAACHSGGLGGGNVKIGFSGGGTNYIPGTSQTLTITNNDPNSTTKAWGFEMTALEGSVATTPGTFAAASTNVNVAASGTKIYARHSSDATNTFSVTWTPPASSVYNGPVVFYVASNAGTGVQRAADSVYTANYTLTLPNLTVTPSALTFNYQILGPTPPAQSVSVGSSGTAFGFNVTSSTNSGGNWLSATPASGTTGGSENVSVNPTGLAAGTYTGSVSVASTSAGNSPRTVAVTLNVTPPPNLTLMPTALTFNYQIGGATPAAQSVSVGSTGSALSYTATSSTNSGGSWLSATPASSTTPGSESVSVNTTGLAAGTYTGSVSVASAGAGNSPQTVAVTLNVTAPPNLTLMPTALTFNYQIGGTTPAAQSVSVGSTGSALSYTATSSTNSGGSWLSATPASSTTPGSESVSVNPTGLAAGTYTGSVSIASAGAGNSPQTVAVTLNVTPQPNLMVTPGTLTFNYQIGGATPAAQSVSVGSTGSALSYTATSSSVGSWLSATPASSTTPGSESVSVNPTGLMAGTYTGSVSIASAGAGNSPQTVAVTLNVIPNLTVMPSTLTFNYHIGGATPAAQSVSVGSTGSALSYTATSSTNSGGSWLSVTPASSTTPGNESVSVSTTGLGTGTYTGSVSISSAGAGNSPQTIAVTLKVTGTSGDFDGDGKADDAVWRPSNGTWYVIPSSAPTTFTATQWGVTGDIPARGDYDGNGKADMAVWRPSNGTWYVIPSSNPSTFLAQQWGVTGDIPVPGDYDGDGKTDMAVWRPSTGTWYILPSSKPGTFIAVQWGLSGDIPVPGDYDGDGKTDMAVWRPSNGTWYVIPSSAPTTFTANPWGISGDMPVPGDYDGDGKTDMAVWRPSNGTWYIIPSSAPTTFTTTQWGVNGDIPVPLDYDGDGKTDKAVWRPSDGTWYIIPSSAPNTFTTTQWGISTDVPVQKPIGQ